MSNQTMETGVRGAWKTPYGYNEIVRFERTDGGFQRIDKWTGDSDGRATIERRFALSPEDNSDVANHYGPHANCQYIAGCSCCWLGFSHTLALHQRVIFMGNGGA